MAKFCETLAETAVVADACDEVGMHVSGAYALRRRNPVFAAGWDAALTIARERLADTLLARAMEGNSELVYRDGEIVGRRDVLDNRLGLAILRRLDRLAETGRATVATGTLPLPAADTRSAHAPRDHPPRLRLDAHGRRAPQRRAGRYRGRARGPQIHRSRRSRRPPEFDPWKVTATSLMDLAERCWFDHVDEAWLTDFPPPEGFEGYQEGEWDEAGYKRACTAEETALLEADQAALRAYERAQEADRRDRWFAMLSEGLQEAGDEDETSEEES